MEKVVIDIHGEYISAAKLPSGEIVTGTITNLNTIEGFLESSNGIYSLYLPSSRPRATLTTIKQKLGHMVSEALLDASDPNRLCTIVGGIKVMNKLLK